MTRSLLGAIACVRIVRRSGHLGARPFGEDREEAREFSAICRASSRLRSRPRRGCQTSRVRRIGHLSGCRLLRAMVSPKTSRAAPRRSVLLASGLGIPPMTLDLNVICISGVPIAGIAAIGAASARQFFLGDGELVGLARPDHELAFAAVADLAGDGAIEKAVPEPVDDNLSRCVERLSGSGRDGARASAQGSVRHALCSSAFMSLMVAENAAAERWRRRHRTPARRRGASGDRGRRRPCAGLRRAESIRS